MVLQPQQGQQKVLRILHGTPSTFVAFLKSQHHLEACALEMDARYRHDDLDGDDEAHVRISKEAPLAEQVEPCCPYLKGGQGGGRGGGEGEARQQ